MKKREMFINVSLNKKNLKILPILFS